MADHIKLETPAELFGYLFMVRDMLHLTHLSQPDRTLSTHLALGELYDGMLPLIDQIVELYTGLYEIPEITIPSSTASQDIIVDLKEHFEVIKANKAVVDNGMLEGVADGILTLMAKTLYKLQYMH